MIDEDAFGILFSYYDVEEDEYGSDDREAFVRRFEAFEAHALGIAEQMELPGDRHVICFGHAVYVEFRDDDDRPQLLSQFRTAAARLLAEGFVNVAVLSHGSRWVDEAEGVALSLTGDSARVARVSRPSEPLRRALYASAFAQSDDQTSGWGPGIYADTEAIEALGKTPKNAPTLLRAPGAEFFRIPALRLEVT